MNTAKSLNKKDFVSSQDVKWCPGCGDYAILSAIQSTMPHIGIPKENIVFISGIGCSSRFPHYMSTYGFHTIHGRAPALATGLKLANPDLSVWVITGDGDGLSIGIGQLMHALRRNIDIKILLFNNNIYGLTKGQPSPTSATGTHTKSTPLGSVDEPFTAASLALSAGASFVARTIDTDPKHMQEVFQRAAQHKGAAIIEILQNCVIFNDKVHSSITAPQNKELSQLRLIHEEPMLFGVDKKQGIRFNPETFALETVEIDKGNFREKDILIHREDNSQGIALQMLLGQMDRPRALGVLRCLKETSYEEMIYEQISHSQQKRGKGDLQKLLHGGDTWVVK